MLPQKISRIECDARSFLVTAQLVRGEIKRLPYSTLSGASISLTTAFCVNAGLSLELSLKLLCLKTKGKHPRSHSLQEISDSLPKHIRSELKAVEDTMPDYEGRLFMQSPTPPKQPSNATVQSMLELSDSIGLFTRRYLFEDNPLYDSPLNMPDVDWILEFAVKVYDYALSVKAA